MLARPVEQYSTGKVLIVFELISNRIYIFSLSLSFEVLGFSVMEETRVTPIEVLCVEVLSGKTAPASESRQSGSGLPDLDSDK